MSHEKSLTILRRLGLGTRLRHVKTERSSVTTAWGVHWDEVSIARDLLQNFFDANRQRLADIRIAVEGNKVTISGPTSCNLERLLFLGSEKGPDDVGQHGEGFKVAAACLLREHQVVPVAVSGDQVLCLRIADEPVQDTLLHPLVYDFFASPTASAGTRLILPGCSQKLIQALQAGLTHFFYEENPLLGRKLWSSWNGHFAIYASTNDRGHIFYRSLKRGEIADIPLVLVLHQEHPTLERKTQSDRDRNAFGDELRTLFYRVFAGKGVRNCEEGQRVIVEAARPCWAHGHALAQAVAEKSHWSGVWSKATTDAVFGKGFFARSTSRSPAQQLQWEAIERHWQEQGLQGLPGYFQKFGVRTAQQHCEDLQRKALEEAKKQGQRSLSPAEADSLQVLTQVLRDLAPVLVGVFDERQTRYSVARTDVLLGELKNARGYKSSEIFLAEQVFVEDFPAALATFLHEHAHIFGADGSRGFTDALTDLLDMVVRHRQELDRYEAEWIVRRKQIRKERHQAARTSKERSLDHVVASLSESEVRKLLLRVPGVVLKQLLDPRPQASGGGTLP